MPQDPRWLLSHSKKVFSQFGEDGIFEAILERLPTRDRWCVEFGAWDGMFLSNARNLIENHGYSAVLIEGSEERHSKLARNFAHNKNIVTMNAFVGWRPGDSLDELLSKTAIPAEFDFLSIDIDGNDYHVWKAFSKYRPKVVCIEFNQTIPTEVVYAQPADPSVTFGSSLAALTELGKSKGYELVCVTFCNAIFVDAKYFPPYGISDNSPHALRADNTDVTYIFSGFDGAVRLTGSQRLPYHNLPIYESRVQQLPRFLRHFPGNYSPMRRWMFFAYKVWHSPRIMFSRIAQRLQGQAGGPIQID